MLFFPLSDLPERRHHECKPKQKETDAGKWFLGEAIEIPLLEAFERKLEKHPVQLVLL